MLLSPAIPVIRIFDWELARAFYVDWLNFSVDWEHRFAPGYPIYAQVRRDELVLHLSQHHGDCTPGGRTFVRCQSVDLLLEQLSRNPYPLLNPSIHDTPWGSRRLDITDPFGNHLSFETASSP